MLGISLTDEQIQTLSAHYTDAGPRVRMPQVVNYARFCGDVDDIFAQTTPRLEMTLTFGSTSGSFSPRVVEDQDKLERLLNKVANLCKSRGVILKYCFNDFEKSVTATPARTTPRLAGKVTMAQFLRLFPFQKEFSEEDIRLIAERYMTESGDVYYLALHKEVSEVMSTVPQPFPRSDLTLRPDHAAWSHRTLHTVSKIQAKVVEKRVRLYEHFQDFDALRKGFCTVGQVKTVFTILNLGKEIDKGDFDNLVAQYTRADGMFCYADFCADVDRAFTTPGLEKAPLTRISMPGPHTTAPARRNRIVQHDTRKEQVAALEDKLRTKIKMRRALLKPTFQDMDRAAQGHVTRSQFHRVMHMLGLPLDDSQVALLCEVYCDLGNHSEFNYTDFCRSLDPPYEQELAAENEANAGYAGAHGNPSRYFDMRGAVQPLMPLTAR